jgi:hypothetical protein
MTEPPDPAPRFVSYGQSQSPVAAARTREPSKAIRILSALILGVAVVTLIVSAAASLRWRYAHNMPVLGYMGFLVDSGKVPYRDFIDINMPGTYAIFALLGRVFGWSDLGLRVFDLILLALLSIATFWWMRLSGRLTAVCAALAFPLYYLSTSSASMEREYVALVLLAIALGLAVGSPGRRLILRGLCTGLLTAATALVKPHLAILILPALAVLFHEAAGSARIGRLAAATAVGLLVPVAGTFGWLLAVGALKPFLNATSNYWPLYAELAGALRPIHGAARLMYIGESLLAGIKDSFLPWALLGIFAVRRQSELRKQILAMSGLVILSAIYPALSGQFFFYHWLPFQYTVLCAASLAIRFPRAERTNPVALVSRFAVLLLLLLLCTLSLRRIVWQSGPRERGMADEVADVLAERMKPGETVQPLDWTGGALRGMLIVRAKPATRFLCDYYFYFQVNRPYIQRLRREFMAELSDAKPTFIIEATGEKKPWPKGVNEFPELQSYIARNYAVVAQESTFRILRATHQGVEPQNGRIRKNVN